MSENRDDDAPEHVLPSTHYYSVEYPGYVESTSVDKAVAALGGIKSLDASLRKHAQPAPAPQLWLQPGNLFAHPIQGNIVKTNKLVLEVIQRKKRNRIHTHEEEAEGEFTATIIGSASRTIRFRALADFHFQPDPNDRISQLRASAETMDARQFQGFTFEPELEDYVVQEPPSGKEYVEGITEPESPSKWPSRSNLRLMPPPILSRQTIPQVYNYKANPTSIVQTFTDKKTGLEKQRLLNKRRYSGVGVTFISTDEPTPEEPPSNVVAKESQVDEKLLQRVKTVFQTRPIWSRVALQNQLSAREARDLQQNLNAKNVYSLVGYQFRDGPYHDLLVRYGYDPRVNSDSRIYQRIYFRSVESAVPRNRRPGGKTEPVDNTGPSGSALPPTTTPTIERNIKSHIYDGKTMIPGMSGFQVCDIVDPVIKSLLQDPSYWRTEFDDTDGWWQSAPLTLIRALMRKKYEGLSKGIIYTDEECMASWEEAVVTPPEEEDGPDEDEDGGEEYEGGRLKKSGKSSVLKGKAAVRLKKYTKKRNRAKARLTEDERRAARLQAQLRREDDTGREMDIG
ncbi:RNA polymerase III transcription factor IIIC subunit-domain-containing protein [Cantharellus anzutake]|uniref:RNA polymerase III transcription factor IIIC subunit-domain-containing protein n=1 Tax=Cantharellus anzutake TaxID=1750568 RepID=UPI00190660E9|nr:RNA polymerase III transcription factor IIIC subunit-domain-containing protein [Cantharellus anzutake]KAF8341420.1 RNA polymerase III transcription factor IIIC subunit-domain-containing protein [Cantharellus anzutake]